MASNLFTCRVPVDGPEQTHMGWLVAVGDGGHQYLIHRTDYVDACRLREAMDAAVRVAQADAFEQAARLIAETHRKQGSVDSHLAVVLLEERAAELRRGTEG